MDGDVEALQATELFLAEACRALDQTPQTLTRQFRLDSDLMSRDPEKLHDIFSELTFVQELDERDFRSIRKRPTRKGVPTCDFTAQRGSEAYAIEVKTIRTESWARPGELLGDGTKASWWSTMLSQNIRTKIGERDNKAITQLTSARAEYACDRTMLLVNYRRLGPSALLTHAELDRLVLNLSSDYPEIDVLGIRLYSGELSFAPALPISH
jgi:hypothetical protein